MPAATARRKPSRSPTIFDLPTLTDPALLDAVHRLDDTAWAEACLAQGREEFASGRIRPWVPSLAVLAARRLERLDAFLPQYESFLVTTDEATRRDWHADIAQPAATGDLLHLSGRLAQTEDQFAEEFGRIVPVLGPPEDGVVLDIGCGGGLWALLLARNDYRVVGTERHADLVASARRAAIAAEVTDRVEFVVDDICHTILPPGCGSRALCISVTPTLPDTAAFRALISSLDRLTRDPEHPSRPRRVVLGSNRWGESRMTAVTNILRMAERGRADALRRLRLVEISWWLQTRHLDFVAERFANVEVIAATKQPFDGTRVDLLLQ